MTLRILRKHILIKHMLINIGLVVSIFIVLISTWRVIYNKSAVAPVGFPSGLVFDLGVLKFPEEVGKKIDIPIQNNTTGIISITDIKSSCSCTRLVAPVKVMAESQDNLTMILVAANTCGTNRYSATFSIPEIGKTYWVSVKADIITSPMSITPPEIQIIQGEKHFVEVRDGGSGDLRVTSVHSTKPGIGAEFLPFASKPCQPLKIPLLLNYNDRVDSSTVTLQVSAESNGTPYNFEYTIKDFDYSRISVLPRRARIIDFVGSNRSYAFLLRDELDNQPVIATGIQLQGHHYGAEPSIFLIEQSAGRCRFALESDLPFAFKGIIKVEALVDGVTAESSVEAEISFVGLNGEGYMGGEDQVIDLVAPALLSRPSGYDQFPSQYNNIPDRDSVCFDESITELMRESLDNFTITTDQISDVATCAIENCRITTARPWLLLHSLFVENSSLFIDSGGVRAAAIDVISNMNLMSKLFPCLSYPLYHEQGMIFVRTPPFNEIAVQDHEGQILFALANKGLSVNHPIAGVPDDIAAIGTVGDLLLAALYNYNKYEDNTFTAPAILHYLSPDFVIIDTLGNSVNIQNLVDAHRASTWSPYCWNTHYYHSLALISEKLSEYGLSSKPLRDFITTLVDRAKSSQTSSGSVLFLHPAPLGFDEQEYMQQSHTDRVEFNGHMLMWLSASVSEEELNSEWFQRLERVTAMDVLRHLLKVQSDDVPLKYGSLCHAYQGLITSSKRRETARH